MKPYAYVFIFFALICLVSPAAVESHSLVRHRRELEFFQNTGKLVQELINNLKKAADQAREAVKQFNDGLVEQAKQCRERFMQNLKKLQDKVSESIKKIQDKFTGSQSAIGECISSHRSDAEAIYHDASEQMAGCTDMRLQEGEELIQNLNVLGENGQEIASQAFDQMRNCTHEHSGNILGMGSCLGSVALKTEVKGASYLMQSGLAIGRINLYMATLPASLEVCAGSSLVNAGMGTAKVLMDIGSCSTNSVINTFGGGSSNTDSASNSASAGTGSNFSAGGSISLGSSNAASSAVESIKAFAFP